MLRRVASAALSQPSPLRVRPLGRVWERFWEGPGKDTQGRLCGVVVMGAPLDGPKIGKWGPKLPRELPWDAMGLSQLSVYP